MGTIWEKSQWPEDIYRLQVSDPVQGGQDGITNVPPTHVADRTRWLLDTILKEHRDDGTHNLRNPSFADDAAIAESKLALDIPTATLKDKADRLQEYVDALRDDLALVMGSDGFYLQGLARLAMLNWRYSDYGFEFEFFIDELSMRDLGNVNTRGAIARDDSLDCENTKGITEGMRLLLSDDEKTEEVEVWRVLEHGRVRLSKDLQHTFNNPAQLGYTDWKLSVGRAEASRGQVFYSRVTTVLENIPQGKLIICRDAGNGNLRVEYRVLGAYPEWVEADSVGLFEATHYPGYFYEEYNITGGKVQLRITATDNLVEVLHMALFATPSQQVVQSIRTPEMLTPLNGETCARDLIRLQTKGFFTAYRDSFAETEYRFMKPQTDEVVKVYVSKTTGPSPVIDAVEAPPIGIYELSCRHKSDLGEYSEWSEPITVMLKNIDRSFGFEGNPKSGGFNYAKWAALGDNDVAYFGFLGAEGAAGFGIAPFKK